MDTTAYGEGDLGAILRPGDRTKLGARYSPACDRVPSAFVTITVAPRELT